MLETMAAVTLVDIASHALPLLTALCERSTCFSLVAVPAARLDAIQSSFSLHNTATVVNSSFIPEMHSQKSAEL